MYVEVQGEMVPVGTAQSYDPVSGGSVMMVVDVQAVSRAVTYSETEGVEVTYA